MRWIGMMAVVLMASGFRAEAMQACPPNAADGTCTSFLLELTGINGARPPATVVTAVAQVIGSLVSDLKIKNYILLQKYPLGGFQACIDPTSDGGYDAAVYAFNIFSVGDQAHWNITLIQSCSEAPTN